MRVAYLINTYPKPSHSFIRREIHALERQGFEVNRFALRGDSAALVDPADLLESDRTELVLDKGVARIAFATAAEILRKPLDGLAALRLAVATGRRSSSGVARHLVYLAEACYLARRFRRLGIAHVHAHFGTNSATVAMLAAALSGVRWSFTVHGPEEFDAPAALSLDEKIRRAAFTVAVSSFGRSQLCRWAEFADWSRIRVVPCGIEPGRFPEPAPLTEGATTLVAIGRFVEQKGQLLLIDAMARAVIAAPELQLRLVGDGELRPEIETAIRNQGLEANVTITGWLDEAQVRAELAACHALVMPSFAEGLPMVIMEAMAAGRPVVATSIAGIPELVAQNATGWLVPAGDVVAMADAIAAVCTTPRARLAAMGAAGRILVLERHDVDAAAALLATQFRAAARAQLTASPPASDEEVQSGRGDLPGGAVSKERAA